VTQGGSIHKFATGIEGFDVIAKGGLPEGRATLVAGTSGSGKTIFAARFLARGIANGENVVFVTFEVAPANLREEFLTLGMDVATWEAEKRWIFVDAAETDPVDTEVVGKFDLSGLLARVRRAIEASGAKRVAFDALDVIVHRLGADALVRGEVARIVSALHAQGVTSVFTAERVLEDGPITRDGIVQFAMDAVVIVRNRLKGGQRHRTIEVLKMRGAPFERGEFAFTIRSQRGITVIPRAVKAEALSDDGSMDRLVAGLSDINELVHGGFFRGSTILVTGDPGTGKTTVALDFVGAGAQQGERALYVDYEGPRATLLRQAKSTGHDLLAAERAGDLHILSEPAEVLTLEDHLASLKEELDTFRPQRVVIDGLRSIERIADALDFRDYLVDLGAALRSAGVTTLITSTATPDQTRHETTHISTLSDVIIILRYVESSGRIDRALTVLKSRGSPHDPSVRQFQIDSSGLHILEPYTEPVGILGDRALAIPITPIRTEEDRRAR
jgi:circadian clock protein KaiC